MRRRPTCVEVEISRGSVLRVGKTPHVKYYLVDGEAVELRGTRAKIIGMNVWGWHYIDPRFNQRIATIIYINGKFVRVA